MTLHDVANFLQVSPMTARRLVVEKKLPFFRVGDRARFLPSQVLAALGAFKKDS